MTQGVDSSLITDQLVNESLQHMWILCGTQLHLCDPIMTPDQQIQALHTWKLLLSEQLPFLLSKLQPIRENKNRLSEMSLLKSREGVIKRLNCMNQNYHNMKTV